MTWQIGWDDITIPITMQSLVVLSMNQIFPKHLGWLSTLLWLVLAAFGMPLLADGVGGINWVNGKSVGYLLGFMISAVLINTNIILKKSNRKYWMLACEQLLGTVIILVCGFILLSFHIGFNRAFQFGVVPFVMGGIVKILIGSLIVIMILDRK